jgi:phenylalanyl-tRNA synthetase beta chain
MIVEFSFSDISRLLGQETAKSDLMDTLAMFGAPPEPPEGDILRVEIFPNRPDLLMAEGTARALKGILGIETGFKLYSPAPATQFVKVDPAVRDVRPFCSFAIVRGVTMDDQTVASVMQVQEKLHQTHGRKRRKVAIGIHDLDKIRFPITYTAVDPERISFVPLDCNRPMSGREILEQLPKGKEYAHLLAGKTKYPLIFDSDRTILSMPPIINGTVTRVTPDTRDLLIDVTGEDEDAVEQACVIIATGLAERGAKIELLHTGDKITPSLAPKTMNLSIAYCRKMLGKDLSAEEIIESLSKMRFSAERKGDDLIEVSVPTYRTDCMHQIDLVEDVAIAHGYGNFEPEIPSLPLIGKENAVLARSNKAKDAMIGLGYQEVYTFAMTSPAKLFTMMASAPRGVAKVSNPKTEDFTIIRDELLPSIISILAFNKHNPYPQQIFEAGDVVVLDDSRDVKSRTERRLAAVFAGGTFEKMKGHLEYLLRQLGLSAEFKPSEKPFYLAGRQAYVAASGKLIGEIGEIHPQVLENNGVDQPSVGFEIVLE